MPTPEQEAILSRLQERYGSAAVPRVDDLDKIPPEFWQQVTTHLDEEDQPTWKKVLSGVYRTPLTPEMLPGEPATIENIWNTVRPPLERAEEIGQLVGSPIIQSLKDNPASLLPGGQAASAALGQKPIAERYVDAGRAYTGAVKGEDGLDLRGATKEATDAMELDRYVAGLAGVLFDPLNLIPGKAITAGPQAASRIGQAARKGVGAGAAQAGQEVAGAVKGYPGAIKEEAEQIGRAAEAAGRIVEGGVKLPAYALVGAGGGGPGGVTNLPRELRGAKPRYGYGQSQFTPDFESDVDKALFIIGQKKKSRSDAKYRAWLGEKGFTDQQMDEAAQQVRDTLKQSVRTAVDTGEETVRIPTMSHAPTEVVSPAAGEPARVAWTKHSYEDVAVVDEADLSGITTTLHTT